MEFRRFAVYYTPPDGPLARFGARWLGWDITAGRPVRQTPPEGLPATLDDLTETPRKYGFHATIKPPFRLAPGQNPEALAHGLARLCTRTAAGHARRAGTGALGRLPRAAATGDTAALDRLAATVVEELDGLPRPAHRGRTRPPPRRRPHAAAGRPAGPVGLSSRDGGVPLPHDADGPLAPDAAPARFCGAARELRPVLPAPFVVDGLSLVGEAGDGRFHLVHRHALSS